MELKSTIFIFLGTMQGLYTRILGWPFLNSSYNHITDFLTTCFIIMKGALKYIICEWILISFSIFHIYFAALVLVTYTFRIFVLS